MTRRWWLMLCGMVIAGAAEMPAKASNYHGGAEEAAGECDAVRALARVVAGIGVRGEAAACFLDWLRPVRRLTPELMELAAT